MSVGLWTKTGTGTYFLYTGQKVEGASSLRMYGQSAAAPLILTRKYFACQSFRIDFYIRIDYNYYTCMKFNASEYGNFQIANNLPTNTWQRRRATFFWDKSTETKWYRLERWTGSEWVLVEADTGLGSIEPGNSTFALWSVPLYGNRPVYYDAMTCEVLA